MALADKNMKASIGERCATERFFAKMEQCLNESDNMKVEIEELELLLGPEDSEVDLSSILMIVKRIFQIFITQDPSDFLVVNTLRWERTFEEKAATGEE